LQYREHEKRYSAHTLTAYRSDLEQFREFAVSAYGIASLKEADYQIIRSWAVSLMSEKLDARSVKRKITTLRSFFRYLLKTGAVNVNPAARVTSPKLSKKLPVFLDENKLNPYLDALVAGDFAETRNQLLLELFYSTGIRLSELIHLKEPDTDLYSCTIRVLGKRNKERILPFSLQMKTLISSYLELKKAIPCPPGRELLVLENGKPMYPKLVYRIVKSHLSQLTTHKKKSPHVLRHTFATHMLNGGADINAIKEMLGHSSLAATQVYTHNNIEKLKNIYKQAHPRA
jgi:integrase/recombinase XerC